MAHPLFARLDRQLELVLREFDNVGQADGRFRRLKKLAQEKKIPADLYHEWSHNASLADGIAAIYTGLESILESIAAEIDRYRPRGDASHADLVDGMAVEVEGVRPAVLAAATRRLMHDARKFRHIARHKYALELRRAEIAANYRLVRRLSAGRGSMTGMAANLRSFAAALALAGVEVRLGPCLRLLLDVDGTHDVAHKADRSG